MKRLLATLMAFAMLLGITAMSFAKEEKAAAKKPVVVAKASAKKMAKKGTKKMAKKGAKKMTKKAAAKPAASKSGAK